jgi:hypothetical protein
MGGSDGDSFAYWGKGRQNVLGSKCSNPSRRGVYHPSITFLACLLATTFASIALACRGALAGQTMPRCTHRQNTDLYICHRCTLYYTSRSYERALLVNARSPYRIQYTLSFLVVHRFCIKVIPRIPSFCIKVIPSIPRPCAAGLTLTTLPLLWTGDATP